MAPSPPLYRQVADALRKEITSGRLEPGAAFPPEMEICERHGVSRHTAREALRILTEDGLIERRRGAGTVVKATDAPAFAQSIGSFDHLLQYAGNTVFEIAHSGAADEETLDRFGLSDSFVRLDGVRRVPASPPQASVTVLVRRDLAEAIKISDNVPGSITKRLEDAGCLTVDRVTQRMEAVGLDRSHAAAIGVEPGTPALRTVRRYRDRTDRIAVLSESFHPQGRFAYEISIDRRSR